MTRESALPNGVECLGVSCLAHGGKDSPCNGGRRLVFVSHTHVSLSTIVFVVTTQPLPRQIRNRNQKFDKNITKRGNVTLGKGEEKDDYPVSKGLIAFFLFLIVGSSVVQVLNLFRRGPALEE